MDGRIGAIREALDLEAFKMSLSWRTLQSMLLPSMDRLGICRWFKGSLGQGDKRTYQMNPANQLEALHEVEMDIEEGADMVMVKPACPT